MQSINIRNSNFFLLQLIYMVSEVRKCDSRHLPPAKIQFSWHICAVWKGPKVCFFLGGEQRILIVRHMFEGILSQTRSVNK